MASQSQIEDEIFARQLQDEEYAEQRRLEQSRQDEALARTLGGGGAAGGNRFAIQAGQSVIIKLHHVRTSRQIGETMYAHYVEQNVMQFELANMRGKFLRATSSGTVEFTSSNDNKCRFYIEPAPNGAMYLLNKNYAGKINTNNTPGWYLSMSIEGALSSNGYKCEMSMWALVAANPPPAQPAPHQNITFHLPQRQASQAIVPPPAPAGSPQQTHQSSEPPVPVPGPSGSEIEMEPVTNFQFNPLFANRPPPAEPTAASASTANTSNTTTTSSSSHSGTIAAPPITAPVPTESSRPPMTRAPSSATAASSTLLFAGHDAGREALMKFFLTPSGIAFLQQPQYVEAYRLYTAGTLGRILHRPDWPIAAGRFVDVAKLPYPPLDVGIANAALSATDGKSFFEEGYCVARGVVPTEMIQNALKLSNYWVNKYIMVTSNADGVNIRKHKSTVELCGGISTDFDMLNLFYATPLIQIAQQFIGNGDVRNPTSVSIIQNYPSMDIPNEFHLPGATMKQLSGDKWNIEGFDNHGHHSPFNILIGIALTDMLVPFEGNFCVHPGSHLLLMENYKQQVLNKSSLWSSDPLMYKKPDLGEPTQLLLKAGDAVLCTQRLATFQSINLSNVPNTMVFFRISHVDHEVLKDPALDGMWLEFRGSEKYVGSTTTPSSATTTSSTTAATPATIQADFLNDVNGLSPVVAATPTTANYWNGVPSAEEIPVATPYEPQADN